jgi:glucose/arabinose dehydrogenase
MAISPDGRLFVTETRAGRVTILPDPNSTGHASGHITYASGLNKPHGIVFHGGYLYIAETNRVIRYHFKAGDDKGSSPEVVIPNIPPGGRHFTRTITFGPDGKLYLSVGSSVNAGIESNPVRAAISRYDADGSNGHVIATGIRNAVGLAWNPITHQLWASVNGRDYLGDNEPPDSVIVVRDGGFYGWPYAYGNHVPDPELGSRAPEKVKAMIPPTLYIQAHSAPLGLTFYTGKIFPAEYRDNLFIAYHGSWNRTVPTGYKVVRYKIDDHGRVVGGQEDFITGWLQNGKAWGRPVDVLTGRRGELYVTDDFSGRVYVVRH